MIARVSAILIFSLSCSYEQGKLEDAPPSRLSSHTCCCVQENRAHSNTHSHECTHGPRRPHRHAQTNTKHSTHTLARVRTHTPLEETKRFGKVTGKVDGTRRRKEQLCIRKEKNSQTRTIKFNCDLQFEVLFHTFLILYVGLQSTRLQFQRSNSAQIQRM